MAPEAASTPELPSQVIRLQRLFRFGANWQLCVIYKLPCAGLCLQSGAPLARRWGSAATETSATPRHCGVSGTLAGQSVQPRVGGACCTPRCLPSSKSASRIYFVLSVVSPPMRYRKQAIVARPTCLFSLWQRQSRTAPCFVGRFVQEEHLHGLDLAEHTAQTAHGYLSKCPGRLGSGSAAGACLRRQDGSSSARSGGLDHPFGPQRAGGTRVDRGEQVCHRPASRPLERRNQAFTTAA